MAEPDLYTDLIQRLEDASTSLSDALEVIATNYGLDDPMFDRLTSAREAVDEIAERLQARADTYGEMAHYGV